ncbi:hypothetical protein SDC9_207673 [bioreactor metagenome]|uniref:Uncharacterized protein n=1 Tax=bioreactor metagenome TaxID=1076179 RepID=A0A645J9X4_9ZZZZ
MRNDFKNDNQLRRCHSRLKPAFKIFPDGTLEKFNAGRIIGKPVIIADVAPALRLFFGSDSVDGKRAVNNPAPAMGEEHSGNLKNRIEIVKADPVSGAVFR